MRKQSGIFHHWPIILLIGINLLVGYFVVNDYGESWDEANMHGYASMSIDAYKNILHPEKMETFYNNEDDRRYYGPAYVMASNLIVDLIQPKTHLEANRIYHYLYFIVFQLGLLFFYMLNKQYFSRPVAIGNTLLFNTQPLLWGHAFVNPKDIQIMAFFLGAIVIGLFLLRKIPQNVNRKNEVPLANIVEKPGMTEINNARNLTLNSIKISSISIGIVLMVYLLKIHTSVITNLVTYAYLNPKSFLGSLFKEIAINIQKIPLSFYIDKGISRIEKFGLFGIILLLAFPILQYFYLLRKNQIQKIGMQLKDRISTFIQKIKETNRYLEFIKKALGYFYYSIVEIIGTWQFWLAAFFLGLISSTRLIGPYAGFIIALLVIIKNWKKAFPIILLYGIFSFLTMYLLWPFLWGAPIRRFYEAVVYMSEFPWNERVLFEGISYRIRAIPPIYLPKLMLIQFTEPFLILSFLGFFTGIYKFFKKQINFELIFLIIVWFFVPFIMAIVLHSPMYDNFRHFFFIIPPLFLIASIALEFLLKKTNLVVYFIAILIFVSPGVYKIWEMYPYEYVYYNSIVGSLDHAQNYYELDYFGTSSKEAMDYVNKNVPYGASILINAPLHMISPIARPDLILKDRYDAFVKEEFDYSVNLNRFNWGEKVFNNETVVFSVERDGAEFITVRKVSQ